MLGKHLLYNPTPQKCGYGFDLLFLLCLFNVTTIKKRKTRTSQLKNTNRIET